MTKIVTNNNQNVTEDRFEIIKPNINWSKKVYHANTPALHQKVMKVVLLVLAFLVEIFIKNPALLAYDLGAFIGNKLFPKRVTLLSPTIAKSEGTVALPESKKPPQEKTAGPAGQPDSAEAPILFPEAPSPAQISATPSPQSPDLSVSISDAGSSDESNPGTPILSPSSDRVPSSPQRTDLSVSIPSSNSAFIRVRPSSAPVLANAPASPAASDDLALLPAPNFTSVVEVAAPVLSPIAARVPSPAPLAPQAESPVAAVVETVASPVAAKAASPAPAVQSAPAPKQLDLAEMVKNPGATGTENLLAGIANLDELLEVASLIDEFTLERFIAGLGFSPEQGAQFRALVLAEANEPELEPFNAETAFGALNLPVPENFEVEEFFKRYLLEIPFPENIKTLEDAIQVPEFQALLQSYFKPIQPSPARVESVPSPVAALEEAPVSVPVAETVASPVAPKVPSPATVPVNTVETSTSPMHFEEPLLPVDTVAARTSPAPVEPAISPVSDKAPSPVAAVVETVASPVAAKAPSPAPAVQSAPAPVAAQAPSPVESAPRLAASPSAISQASAAEDEQNEVPEFTSAIVANAPVRSPIWGGLRVNTAATQVDSEDLPSPVRSIIDPEDARKLQSPVESIIDPDDRELRSPVESIIDPDDRELRSPVESIIDPEDDRHKCAVS